MITDKIALYLSQNEKLTDEALRYEIEKLAGVSFKRQFMTSEESRPGVLRMSSGGRCARQLAYAFHGYEKKGKELDARAKVIFWAGDMTETMVMGLAKISGAMVTAYGLNQLKVSLKIGDVEVPGHPDGILIEDGEFFLVEVKSMSSFGFEKFEKGELDNSYLCQIMLYLKSLGLLRCVVVGVNKDSGVMHEMIIAFDETLYDFAFNNLKSVLESTKDNLPERPFHPDANGILPWNCLYCSHWGHCWDAEKVLVKKSYKLKVRDVNKEQT